MVAGHFVLAQFLVAHIVVMPMMGMPLFSGSAIMAMGSLIGHLIYGGVVGAVYGPVPAGVHARSDASHSMAAH